MMKMKMVLNRQLGYFDLSLKAIQRFAELENLTLYYYKRTDSADIYEKIDIASERDLFRHRILVVQKDLGSILDLSGDSYSDIVFDVDSIDRCNPNLIKVVEELGKEVNCFWSWLEVVEIKPGTKFFIDTDDGMETIITEDDIVWTIAD